MYQTEIDMVHYRGVVEEEEQHNTISYIKNIKNTDYITIDIHEEDNPPPSIERVDSIDYASSDSNNDPMDHYAFFEIKHKH
jgi:hypothetical protein